MKYQDLKIRDMLRLLAIGVVCIVVTIGMLGFRSGAQPFLEGLSIFHHNGYNILLFVLPIMTVLTVGVTIQYLVTTPEQNAKYILKARKNHPPTLSDVDNPNYRLPTWKYILQRLRRSTEAPMGIAVASDHKRTFPASATGRMSPLPRSPVSGRPRQPVLAFSTASFWRRANGSSWRNRDPRACAL